MAAGYPLNPMQFKAVSALAGPGRFRHFVGRVADWQQVWSLKEESGWVSAADDQGNIIFPVWPHPDYAAACAVGHWSGSSPTSIEVHEFLERWLPGLDKDGLAVAVFPTPTKGGVIMPAYQLQRAIQDELSGLE